jgi:uncharacterized protein (DUF4213/DUF364 family)
MSQPYEIYDLLQDYAGGSQALNELILGQVWTYCDAGAIGLAMSPDVATRTLPWSGSLKGQRVSALTAWLREFDVWKSAVGMAVVNAGINAHAPAPEGVDLFPGDFSNNLAVFEYFRYELAGKHVVVIGRYPGLHEWAQKNQIDMAVLERQPGTQDYPDSACEYLLPDADWVFITASSLTNKTFPRLSQLARDATTVLMGPTTPWLPEFHHFGIDYLAGVVIDDSEQVRTTLAEGGGVRLFESGLHYRIVAVSYTASAAWSQTLIAQTVREKENLSDGMSLWYAHGNKARFPHYAQLEAVNRRLSRLDTCFKKLWDASMAEH